MQAASRVNGRVGGGKASAPHCTAECPAAALRMAGAQGRSETHFLFCSTRSSKNTMDACRRFFFATHEESFSPASARAVPPGVTSTAPSSRNRRRRYPSMYFDLLLHPCWSCVAVCVFSCLVWLSATSRRFRNWRLSSASAPSDSAPAASLPFRLRGLRRMDGWRGPVSAFSDRILRAMWRCDEHGKHK